jgi:hypothetical protein
LGERPLGVTDIEAGTEILSRLLLHLGHEAIAIDPAHPAVLGFIGRILATPGTVR